MAWSLELGCWADHPIQPVTLGGAQRLAEPLKCKCGEGSLPGEGSPCS